MIHRRPATDKKAGEQVGTEWIITSTVIMSRPARHPGGETKIARVGGECSGGGGGGDVTRG